MRGLRLARATLKHVDFRGAIALGIADGYDSLRGAIIDGSQLIEIAPGLAAAHGVVVKE
jgi:hypothetical protein